VKSNVRASFIVVLVVVLAMLVFAGVARSQELESTGKTAGKDWSPIDNVDRLKKTLDRLGFNLDQGGIEYVDLVKNTCLGLSPDTLANNPWPNAYMAVTLPPHPGVPSPLEWAWQLREDEAIVMVGETPPDVAYFSYQTFMLFQPPYQPNVATQKRYGIAVGDTINIGTVNLLGPERASQPIVYIVTGNRETERRVRAAVQKAGYPASIVNVETISPAIFKLGVGLEGSWFYLASRSAVPADKDTLNDYIKDPPYVVFRVTPKTPLAADPEPVPVLRPHGTGRTEMELYPALKQLRQAILDKLEQSGYGAAQRKELDTKVWSMVTRDGREMILESPYVAAQRDYQIIGATRDTNYLATYPNFMLREGEDEFVIVYGVNHQKTGKVTYSSVSIYADKDRWFGVKDGTVLSPDFGDSARRYLPDNPPAELARDIDMFYVLKVARDCQGEEYCLQVNQPDFLDINDDAYTCELDDLDTSEIDPAPLNFNNEEMFFLFRSYMEPETLVAPDDNELLYDRAIYFGPYFSQP